MRNRYEIILSGAGGHGMLLAGLILAEAASIYDGKFVTQTGSYGPEARGGASKSEVVISTEEIDYPKVMQPNLLLAMTQESHDKYYKDLMANGVLIVDSLNVTHIKRKDAVKIPIIQISRTELGNELFANTVSLGIIVEFTNIVSKNAIEKAILARTPKGTKEKNKKALELGFEVAQRYKRGEEIKY